MCRSVFAFLCSIAVLTGITTAADQSPDLAQFQGKWDVVDLVEDGQVVPKEAIEEWLPSGGHFEFAENALLTVSHEDGKKHVKLFSLDETQYPKGIDLSTRDKKVGVGIYRFDEGRLIVCFADPEGSTRPTEFSAKAGSKQMLMTLRRVENSATPQPVPANRKPTEAAAKILTDAQVTDLLKGTWKYSDDAGALVLALHTDGTFSTVREATENRLFHKVFIQSPISTGKWSVQNGTLNLYIQSSVHPDRVNKIFGFAVRSISARDFIFVDYLGRVGQATKLP